jgi:hypothetical protein
MRRRSPISTHQERIIPVPAPQGAGPELYKADDRCGMFHVRVSSTYSYTRRASNSAVRGHAAATAGGARRCANARSDSQARPGRHGCVTCPDHRRSGSPYLLLAVFDNDITIRFLDIRFRVSAPREGLAKAATSIVRFSRGRRAQRDQEPMWLGSSRSRVGR